MKKCKIDILREDWLKELIMYHDDVDDYFKLNGASGSPEEEKLKFCFYTNEHVYYITAIDRKNSEGYLGCTCSNRKPLAGESWTRGCDLPDGKFNLETWCKIKDAIIMNELVRLEPIKDPVSECCIEEE